jgi:hypothetical protein
MTAAVAVVVQTALMTLMTRTMTNAPRASSGSKWVEVRENLFAETVEHIGSGVTLFVRVEVRVGVGVVAFREGRCGGVGGGLRRSKSWCVDC